VPALFTATSAAGDALRSAFLADVGHLAKSTLPTIGTSLDDSHNAGESALSGAASPDFPALLAESRTGVAFLDQVKAQLAQANVSNSCLSDDPITPQAILRRSAALSCAGCHAPERFLGADRSVGCGITWPKSLGQTHIDEHGNLSEALTDVYLPRRADVLLTYLRACNTRAVEQNLVPNAGGWQK